MRLVDDFSKQVLRRSLPTGRHSVPSFPFEGLR